MNEVDIEMRIQTLADQLEDVRAVSDKALTKAQAVEDIAMKNRKDINEISERQKVQDEKFNIILNSMAEFSSAQKTGIGKINKKTIAVLATLLTTVAWNLLERLNIFIGG